MWDDVHCITPNFCELQWGLPQIRLLPRNPRFPPFQIKPSSEYYELFLSQVDYKRLSEDLSKIVNMKGKISLGSFVAAVKKGA